MNQRQGIDAREVLAKAMYSGKSGLAPSKIAHFLAAVRILRQAAGDLNIIAFRFNDEDGRVELLKAEEVEFPASSLSSFPFPTVQAVHRVYRLHPIIQDQEKT